MIDAPLDYLVRKLEKQQHIVAGAILKGELSDLEYKRLCGTMQGFAYAIDLILDTSKRIENDEEGEKDE